VCLAPANYAAFQQWRLKGEEILSFSFYFVVVVVRNEHDIGCTPFGVYVIEQNE
jgi:hypothetical protein